jgi:hypothetical protein
VSKERDAGGIYMVMSAATEVRMSALWGTPTAGGRRGRPA